LEPPDSLLFLFENHAQLFVGFDINTTVAFLVTVVFLFISALFSGSEVAYFSLGPAEIEALETEKDPNSQRVLELLNNPNKLLATILIANNFINVAIIILSSFTISQAFDFSNAPVLGFILQVVVITFLIILVGEVAPKVYATKRNLSLARFMSKPLDIASRLFTPLSAVLMGLIGFVSKRFVQKKSLGGVDELGQALDLADSNEIDDKEQQILRGIVNFGNTEASQIMTPRMDVQALDIDSSYEEVLATVLSSGYSRIPVYKETFDSVVGILFIKDLLPYIEQENFSWKGILRKPFFVPENKKIDDLLREFQSRKTHMAIVVDEYGGSSGIVTLEDIIEEIIGEISDEFDEEEINYSKIDDNTFIFEAKTPLNDFYKIIEAESTDFEENRGEAESLGGFILEISGKIPKKHEKISFKNYRFTIEAADKKRIKQIKVIILPPNDDDNNEGY
jgi:putative hemolysin